MPKVNEKNGKSPQLTTQLQTKKYSETLRLPLGVSWSNCCRRIDWYQCMSEAGTQTFKSLSILIVYQVSFMTQNKCMPFFACGIIQGGLRSPTTSPQSDSATNIDNLIVSLHSEHCILCTKRKHNKMYKYILKHYSSFLFLSCVLSVLWVAYAGF